MNIKLKSITKKPRTKIQYNVLVTVVLNFDDSIDISYDAKVHGNPKKSMISYSVNRSDQEKYKSFARQEQNEIDDVVSKALRGLA